MLTHEAPFRTIADPKPLAPKGLASSVTVVADTLIDNMPGLVYFFDECGGILRWNLNFQRVSGYSGEEIPQMHYLAFFSEGDQRRLQQRMTGVLMEGRSTIEASFVSKDGCATPHYFTSHLNDDRITCLVGIGVNNDDRSREQIATARLVAIVESSDDAIVGKDLNGIVTSWNSGAMKVFGYSASEMIGQSITRLIPPERQQEETAILAKIQNGDRVRHFETVRIRQDGSSLPVSVTVSAIKDHAGRVIGASKVARDITARAAAEVQIHQLNTDLEARVARRTAELETANRALEAFSDAMSRDLRVAEAADQLKSAFLATMSHELRTPLNCIIGFTGILLNHLAGPLTTEQATQLGMVMASARHLLALINDVLDLSKIEAGQFDLHYESFDLSALLERVTAMLQPLADDKGLTLAVVISPIVSEMMSDERRVEQILFNLLNNAVKFTARGSVTLTADIVVYFHGSPDAPPRPAVRLCVADSGMGIKPEHLATLFQPFRQIDSGLARQNEGTGLGLAISSRLAALLGGGIVASSAWLKGSEFTVTIPLQRSMSS
jgi:PAS domain S-box-containing protein